MKMNFGFPSFEKPGIVSQTYKAGSNPQNCFALFLSGDGLKTSLANTLSKKLSEKGITTLRIRSLNYFWTARSPKGMAKDIQRQLNRRLKSNPKDRFLLIGFSFGAGTLPFAANLLPPHLIKRIDRVVLLAPPAQADFEFSFRSWVNLWTSDALNTAAEISRLSLTVPVLYLRGEDDFIGPSESLKESKTLKIITLPGGHDFNKDYDRLIELILNSSAAS
jgi:type IV secretory pathway VirJ component